MKNALPVLMLLLGAMCVAGLIVMLSLRRRLKREPPEIYVRLSRASLQIANDLSFARFVLSGSYAASVSSELKRKLDAMRVFAFVYFVVFAATLLGMAGV